MENISIILTDLDGTLFRDDKTISDYTIKTIERAQSKGIMVGVSTARAIVNVEGLLGDFKPDFYISNGGALVTINKKPVYACEFSIEETRRMLAKAYEVCGEDAEITLDNATTLFWNKTEEEREGANTPAAEYDDFKDFNSTAMKICVKTLDKEKAEAIASCIGIENVDLLPFSDIPWYKFSKKNATKEQAILALANYLQVPVCKMAAFGDDFSDIGMLKLCGKGVAMANAIPPVKQIADEITLSNENDGVARWIEENLL